LSSPLVSIIIPTYNRANLILETLNSIKEQTYTHLECIVVDDGSTDDTEKILTEFCLKDKRFQFHHRPNSSPKGANSCRNYGFKLSQGTYINWFDSDDFMHQDKLKIQVEALEKSEFSFSVCQTLVFENSIENIIGLRHGIIYSDKSFEDYLSRKIIWMTPSAVWKKEFLLKLDYLFDEELQAAQEWEFHCRALFVSPTYHVTEKSLVYIRRHLESISYNNDIEKRELNYLVAREKVFNFLKEKKIKNNYLIKYFITQYKQYLKKRDFSTAIKILKKQLFFCEDLTFFYRMKLMISYFFYAIFNKGEFIFKGKRFKTD
tara:strand:+ start:1093 stop:2046 length:954 start_codon:yes stop_codon:yes gene_type:complete